MSDSNEPKKCKAQVFDRESWSAGHQCKNKATTEAGYCKTHDPECKKAREAERPPTKWERRCEARKQLAAYLERILTPEQRKVVERGIRWGHDDWASPPWPLDIENAPPPDIEKQG